MSRGGPTRGVSDVVVPATGSWEYVYTENERGVDVPPPGSGTE
jgi:hypothetical protein